jgi:hypothetical protein
MHILGFGNHDNDGLAFNEFDLFGQLYTPLVDGTRKRFHQILLVTIVAV